MQVDASRCSILYDSLHLAALLLIVLPIFHIAADNIGYLEGHIDRFASDALLLEPVICEKLLENVFGRGRIGTHPDTTVRLGIEYH